MNNKKGFTITELLVVVGIIAALVAAAFPTYTSLVEKSREKTDLNSIRSAYAEVHAAAVTKNKQVKNTFNNQVIYQSNNMYMITIGPLEQHKDDWQMDISSLQVEGVKTDDSIHWVGKPKAKGNCKIVIDGNETFFIWEGDHVANNVPDVPVSEGDYIVDEPVNPSDPDTDVDFINYDIITGEDAFDGVRGNIYKYKDKYYVCIQGQHFAAGGTPETWYQWQFDAISLDGTVLTDDDLEYPWNPTEGVFVNIKRGTIYQKDNIYYIRHVDSYYARGPSLEPENWTQVNPGQIR